jgi:hypothetical protein
MQLGRPQKKGGLFCARNSTIARAFSLSEEGLVEKESQTELDKAMVPVKKAAGKLKGENKSEPTVETPVEDAFVLPDGKIRHEAPPKDPNAPSGSLSSDDEEVVPVDLSPRAMPK